MPISNLFWYSKRRSSFSENCCIFSVAPVNCVGSLKADSTHFRWMVYPRQCFNAIDFGTLDGVMFAIMWLLHTLRMARWEYSRWHWYTNQVSIPYTAQKKVARQSYKHLLWGLGLLLMLTRLWSLLTCFFSQSAVNVCLAPVYMTLPS